MMVNMETPIPQGPPLPSHKRQRRRRRGILRDTLETLVIVAIVYFGFRAVLLPYEVDGYSMNPYLDQGERIFVSRVAYSHVDTNRLWNLLPWEDREDTHTIYLFDPPARGDIIVLHPPYASDEPYIKRVIGLPGETVSFRDGQVLIDGVPLVEDYIEPGITWCRRAAFCSLVVPDHSVFVLGDNRGDSTDSRMFGPVGYDQIIGQAVFANWPFDKIGPIDSPDYAAP